MHTVQKKVTGFSIGVVMSVAMSTSIASPLNISHDPLFIGNSVPPGIFIMMDDSGSMDWSILTQNHYSFNSYYGNDSWLNTWGLFWGFGSGSDNCDGWDTYTYMYDNSDDLYGNCEVSRNNGVYERDWRIKSAEFNVMYYNPDTTYTPWKAKNNDSTDTSATNFTDADYSSVLSNPQPGEAGYSDTFNLESAGFVWEVADATSYGYCGTSPDGPEWDGSDNDHNRCSSDSDCSGGETCTLPQVDLWDDHTRYTVDGSVIHVQRITYDLSTVSPATCPADNPPDPARINTCFNATITDLPDITDTATVNSIKQNIANWYQYNRRRSLVAKSAVASVLESSPYYRFGFGTLQETDTFTPLPAVDDVYSVHNQDLFNKFAEWNWQGQGTPLRDGFKQAGEYFRGNRSGFSSPIVDQCQQNFTILFTDGYYNGSVSGFSDNNGDGASSTLADIAYFYYTTDLDTTLANVVPTTDFDTQSQQHMVTFSVAFGVQGNLVDTDGDGWPNPLPNHSSPKWFAGSSVDTDPERIDDMWHAAYDSRGAFISAKTPTQLVQAMNDALAAISERVGSASSAAASTGASVLTETNVFFAYYDSKEWSGDLLAYDITTDASTALSSFNNSIKATDNFYANPRTNFFSWNDADNSPIDFTWSALDTEQQAFLNDAPDTVSIDNDGFGDLRLEFIKGDTTNDGQDVDTSSDVTTFRNRNGKVFGDILNSAPQFVGSTLDNYGAPLAYINEDLSESSTYSLFQINNKDRQHMIYVGANDGMLHALLVDSNISTNASTSTSSTIDYLEDYGKEVFAYIPSAVIKRLHKLTSPSYNNEHRYFVDGTPRITDAYSDTWGTGVDGWKTVLVSGLGAGGQGIFALDVTDGASVSNNSAVLWEFNDSDDPDLGYTYSRPVVARLHDGNWYAVFGNGYNNTETANNDLIPDSNVSTTGHAVLFLVKMSGPTGPNNSWVLGTDYFKLDTGVGDVSTPNGLSEVTTLDVNGDQVVDAVYAGDLKGNLWRFDLLDDDSDVNTGNFPSSVSSNATVPTSGFTIAYKESVSGTVVYKPVFTTETDQAITSAPIVAHHPVDGYLIMFGTGKFIETTDASSTGQPTQSLYGVWDSCVQLHTSGTYSGLDIANGSEYQINYNGTSIPTTAGNCSTVQKSDMLEQLIVKQKVENFTQHVDATTDVNGDGTIDGNDASVDINGDGVINDSDVVTDPAGVDVTTNTEEIRVTTGYHLLDYDKDIDGNSTIENKQIVADTIDGESIYRYESEIGWLNEDKTAISKRGWYLDMIFEGNNKSERNINKPILIGGVVLFNSYMPTTAADSCEALGDSWLYALNASDGSQLAVSIFDMNYDGKIDNQDEYKQSEVIGARKMTGFTPPGTLIGSSSRRHNITYGGVEPGIYDTNSLFREGRQSWRILK